MVEPRIAAAGFFAGGYVPRARREEARRVTIPLLFLVQWDDEGSPRQRALDLFDAFAAKEKTLHANLEGHTGTPWFEVEDWVPVLRPAWAEPAVARFQVQPCEKRVETEREHPARSAGIPGADPARA